MPITFCSAYLVPVP